MPKNLGVDTFPDPVGHFQWNWSFSLNCSNFVDFLARKTFFSFKQVRISSEIDRYHYQSANAEPMAILRHCVISESTVGAGGGECSRCCLPYIWQRIHRKSKILNQSKFLIRHSLFADIPWAKWNGWYWRNKHSQNTHSRHLFPINRIGMRGRRCSLVQIE